MSIRRLAAAGAIIVSGLVHPAASAQAHPQPAVQGEATRFTKVEVQRFRVISSRPFDEVVARLAVSIGHPDMKAFHGAIVAARTAADLEATVHAATGASQLMEFARFDAGEVLRKEQGGHGPKILRLLVGNPLIMQQMAKTAPDAAAYAPVTILIDERADGVHLSYDSMASLLAPYGSEAALAVARDLDAKVEALLEAAAAGAE